MWARNFTHLAFSTTSRLNNEYLRKKHHKQPEKTLENANAVPKCECCPKISWTLVHKRRKLVPSYLPNLRKYCFLLLCQQRKFTKQNSTKFCWEVSQVCKRMSKIGIVPSPKTEELKPAYFVTVFNSTNYARCRKIRQELLSTSREHLLRFLCERNKVGPHGECKRNNRN